MSTTTQTRTAGPTSGQSANGSVVERIKARAIESRENSKANARNGRRSSQPAKKDMPNYPGLERWSLIEKIGDGAFSTVYRASDTKSEFNEVAVKVMRKYEMNDKQVSKSMLFDKPTFSLCRRNKNWSRRWRSPGSSSTTTWFNLSTPPNRASIATWSWSFAPEANYIIKLHNSHRWTRT